jgi:hypothetical protein
LGEALGFPERDEALGEVHGEPVWQQVENGGGDGPVWGPAMRRMSG